MDFARKNFDSRQQPPFLKFLRLDGDGVNEKQTLTITGTPIGGNFTITKPQGAGAAADTTAAIAYNAAASAVESARSSWPRFKTISPGWCR